MLLNPTTITIAILGCFLLPVEGANRTTFDGQMFELSKQIQDTMANDPRLKGQTITLGEFRGEGEATGTNYGLRIELALKEKLGTLLVAKGKFTLAGSYLFTKSEDPDIPDAMVLVITAQIKDDRGREVKPISVEVNDTDGIAQVLGITVAIAEQQNARFDDRNKELRQAKEKPAFLPIGDDRVAAVGAPKLGMRILRKVTFNGTTTSVTPENVAGEAVVTIGSGDFYEIELVNLDTIDVVATLTVDGLDVANTFATDKGPDGKPIHWPGYLLPAGQSMIVRGWLNTIDQNAKDNVFSFGVVNLGQGAASAQKARGSVGVITVQFREAFPPGAKPKTRGIPDVETAKGEGLQESMKAQPLQIADLAISTVSIRYGRPRN